LKSQLYADALEHEKAEFAELVKLHALISRMRLLSSPEIVEAALGVGRNILETYHGPRKTLRELETEGLAASDAMDPLRGFSEAFRDELWSSGELL
jgi:hypothetical protein